MTVYLMIFMLIFFPFYRIRVGAYNRFLTIEQLTARHRAKYCMILFVAFVAIMFLKHDYVGTDTPNYRIIYDTLTPIYGVPEFSISSEHLFYTLIDLMYKMGIEFRYLLLIQGFLYMSAISILIYKYSKMPQLSYFLFFTLGDFIFHTTMRQCMALSFTIFAFILLEEKKVRYYKVFAIVLWIIAIGFHISAGVFIVGILLKELKFSFMSVSLGVGGFVSMWVLTPYLMPLILKVLNETYTAMETGGLKTLLILVIITVVGVLYGRKFIKAGETVNLALFNMLVIGIVLFPLGRYNPFFFRLIKYFTIYQIIYIPNLAVSVRDNLLRRAMIVLFVIYGLASFFYLSNSIGVRTFPYMFYWEEYINVPTYMIGKEQVRF